jgi:hypothetical protein
MKKTIPTGRLKEEYRKPVRVIAVHWRGPFQRHELDSIGESGVLYLAVGRCDRQRKSRFQYCGITEQSFCYRHIRHKKLDLVIDDFEVWIGWIRHPRLTKRADLEAVESLIVYYWGILLNERKRGKKTAPALTLVSRWFKQDGTIRTRKPAVLRELYDVLSFDGKRWSVANLQHWDDYD